MIGTGTLRLIDANLNRAREGLRVMEDLARFVLSDGGLASDLKSARHGLRTMAEQAGLEPLQLASWRDTPGDVGTSITTDGERSRTSVSEVATASANRVGEALRVLEELFKLDAGSAAAAGRAKQLRYQIYDLQKRLTMALGSTHERAGTQWRLCVLITASLCVHHPWEDVARRAIAGGADCLQLREKTLDGGELLERARRLVDLAGEHGRAADGVAVIVNDRPDVALLAGATGVHLGQTDLPIDTCRRLVGSKLLVGVSTANMDQARAAVVSGADYCGVGPMFVSQTKQKPVLSGIDYLRAYLSDEQTARVPHLAISGITPATARELALAGAKGIAVSSAVCGAMDPERSCAELIAAMTT